MSVAAIAIDNFLSTSQWDGIQSDISSHLTSPTYSESRNIIHTQINGYIKNKLQSLNIWQDAWEDEIGLFSSLNSIPSGINFDDFCIPS